MKIHFLGASETVTGSNYLIEACGKRFLIDCGLYQGDDRLESRNAEEFKYDPAGLDFMILTHSHIDHSGRIPLLTKRGFSGKIYCTRPTSYLADIMLKDSAMIQEEEASLDNKRRKKAGLPPDEPLYSVEDAEDALQYLYPVDYDAVIKPADGISFRFVNAGHLLGSSYIQMEAREDGQTKTITFSGDLGSGNSKLLDDYRKPSHTDYVVMESTYGIRNHRGVNERSRRLADEIQSTLRKGGTVIIPSFAVGRTQEIVYEIRDYYEKAGRMDEFFKIPIYVDSPLGVEATKIYSSHHDYFTREVSEKFTDAKNPLHARNIKYVTSPKDSSSLVFNKDPKVIISASGMCSAGRVKMHLKVNLPRYESKVIFVGFQAEGTVGSLIQTGEPSIELYGEPVPVKAKVVTIEGFSGHADSDGLLRWLKEIKGSSRLKGVFLCHGEIESLQGLKEIVMAEVDSEATVTVPKLGSIAEI